MPFLSPNQQRQSTEGNHHYQQQQQQHYHYHHHNMSAVRVVTHVWLKLASSHTRRFISNRGAHISGKTQQSFNRYNEDVCIK